MGVLLNMMKTTNRSLDVMKKEQDMDILLNLETTKIKNLL